MYCISERVPGKKRIQVMADSDSDSADCQTPKKAKLVLTVKEKEERYMAAAKIMPNYDTMVSHRPLAMVFLLFHLCWVRGAKRARRLHVFGIWRLGPGIANSCLAQWRRVKKG